MKWISFLLFFFLCSGVYAFGLSPSKVDFGEVKPGEEYVSEFILVNEEADVELDVESTSYWIHVDENIVLEKETLDQILIKLEIPKDAEPGVYEDLVIFKRKDNGEEFSLGEGVGLKVKYNVVGSVGNKITGYAVAEGETDLNFWMLGGLIVFFIISLVGWRIYRLRNIYSSNKCTGQEGAQSLYRK